MTLTVPTGQSSASQYVEAFLSSVNVECADACLKSLIRCNVVSLISFAAALTIRGALPSIEMLPSKAAHPRAMIAAHPRFVGLCRNNSTRYLAQPFRIAVTKTPVFAVYPLTYRRNFNFAPNELLLSVANCKVRGTFSLEESADLDPSCALCSCARVLGVQLAYVARTSSPTGRRLPA